MQPLHLPSSCIYDIPPHSAPPPPFSRTDQERLKEVYANLIVDVRDTVSGLEGVRVSGLGTVVSGLGDGGYRVLRCGLRPRGDACEWSWLGLSGLRECEWHHPSLSPPLSTHNVCVAFYVTSVLRCMPVCALQNHVCLPLPSLGAACPTMCTTCLCPACALPQGRLPNYVTMDKLSNIFAAREDMAKAMVKLEQVFSLGSIDKEV